MNKRVIAIPIAVPTIAEAIRRVPQAGLWADFIEYRLDYLTDLDGADPRRGVDRLIEATRLPVILTWHPDPSRGPRLLPTFQDQVTFWKSLFPLAASKEIFFDLDLRLAEYFKAVAEPVPWSQVIVSHHNFKETPLSLVSLYQRMRATPARLLKIATLARAISDNVILFSVFEQAKRDRRPFIGLTMGFEGLMSRILSPAWGGFLTFGSLHLEEQTAPGQVTAQELRDLYRVPALSAETAVAGVIGSSVQHSLSPRLHNTAYQRLGLDWVYLPLLVKDLKPFMGDFVIPGSRRMNWNLRGLSVTIPHKVEIVNYLDGLDSLAGEVGAVNTVVVEPERLIGHNTDVEGAMRPLRERLSLKGNRAVILGAGGAARAVGVGLKKEGADVLILARDMLKANTLAERLGAGAGTLGDLAGLEYAVLINATPLGMGEALEETPAPVHVLKPGKIVFDLVARLEPTRLLREAHAMGCRTINGLEMLVHQAALQFELWTHHEPPIEIMFESVGLTTTPGAGGGSIEDS